MRELLLGKIAEDIGNFLATWGRIEVRQTKEKYNTVRVYCSFGWYSFHNIIFPRYMVKHQWVPQWLWKFDITYSYLLLRWVNYIAVPIQEKIYRFAYKKAVETYPSLKDNIICCADFDELLRDL